MFNRNDFACRSSSDRILTQCIQKTSRRFMYTVKWLRFCFVVRDNMGWTARCWWDGTLGLIRPRLLPRRERAGRYATSVLSRAHLTRTTSISRSLGPQLLLVSSNASTTIHFVCLFLLVPF